MMTDIDDTLTCDGAIEPVALHTRYTGAAQALHDLHNAGVRVVATSGRPLGWSEPFARAWPVRAIVAESGALALMRDGARVLTEYVQDKATRRQNAQRLQAVAQQVLARVPGAGCRVRCWRRTAPAAPPISPSTTESSRGCPKAPSHMGWR